LTDRGPTQLLVLVTANPAFRDSERLVVMAHLDTSSELGGGRVQTVIVPGLKGSLGDLALAVLSIALLGGGWALRRLLRPLLAPWQRAVSLGLAVALAYASWQLLLGSASRLL
jgi:hypothetical protein